MLPLRALARLCATHAGAVAAALVGLGLTALVLSTLLHVLFLCR